MSKVKILIDPGHDSADYNRSPVVKEYCEGQQMWILSNLLKAELETYEGMEVALTKSQVNQAITVTKRGRMGKGYDFLLSMHSNACDTESVDRPVGIYLTDDDCGPIDEESKTLAQLLSRTVANVMGTGKAQQYSTTSEKDRDGDGKRNDDYYGVLYGAHQVGTTAVILEHSFHTNTAAAKWLLSEANLRKLAKAEAAALAEYYGLRKKIRFSDVPEDAWYADAVYACAAQGIMEGDGDGKFRPDDPITRAELAAVVQRMKM